MDFGELIFKWLHTGSLRRKERYFEEQKVLNISESAEFERLDLVCSALTNSTVRIHLSDALEYPDPMSIFLPRTLGLASADDGNFLIYLYRVMAFHGALSTHQILKRHYTSTIDAQLTSALAAPGIHRSLSAEYTGFGELLSAVRSIAAESASTFLKLHPSYAPWTLLLERTHGTEDFTLSAEEKSTLERSWRKEWEGSPHCPMHVLAILPQFHRHPLGQGAAPPLPHESTSDSMSRPARSFQKQNEVHVKTVARPEVKNLDKQNQNPVNHVFEKLLTAEEHRGGSKTQDGADESEDHADALSELTLDSVARTETGAESTIKAIVQLDSLAPSLAVPTDQPFETIFTYPEWFIESRRYMEDYCRVYESTLPESLGAAPVGPHAVHPHLSEKLSSFLNESRWKPRQKDGTDFDLDAVVRWRSQVHGDGPVDHRLYMGRKRLERNLAILILMDTSLSTDAWIGTHRILDLMKSSVSIISEAFDGLDDRFAIATFNSHSRKRCRFKWIKGFDDPWPAARRRLISVQPDGYTRIGSALRHAHSTISKVKARRKLILLFSDAKPSDYDPYEGEHGLGDVRKAVTEIKNDGIFMKGVAVAQENRGSLARMFGSGQYQVISEPFQIADKVLRIFTEMMGGR